MIRIESFFKFSYGLQIICSADNRRKNGFVANTVFQVTSDPPQLAISCSKKNLTTGIIAASGKFSISVLTQDAGNELLTTFGYKSGYTTDKFEKVKFITGKSGVPIVTECSAAWFECEVVSQLDIGTHILFIGKVLEAELTETTSPVMTYAWYREFRKGASPKNAPTYIDPSLLLEQKQPASSPGRKYRCLACSYIYDPAEGDPDSGIAPGTAFEDIPDDWMCPVCGATKDMFEEIV